MLLPRLVFGGLLLGAPLFGFGQTAALPAPAPAPTPRFYVGLAAYSSAYHTLGGYYGTTGTRVPLQLTAGYQLRPRLAVQVGVVSSATAYSYFYAGRTYTDPSIPSTYFQTAGTNTHRNTSVSVLARYTLTRNPAHRVQFDLLGGVGLEHSAHRSQGSHADSVQNSLVVSSFDTRSANTDLLLTLGPSLRYRFGQRLELTFDFTLNTPVLSSSRYRYDLTGATALGLRYRFGRR